MGITYQPLISKSGFKSPGFIVDPRGNITVRSITVTASAEGEDGGGGAGESILTVDNVIIRGTQLVQGGEDSTYIAFGDGITGSNLQRLGVLQYLDVIGDTRLVNGSSSFTVDSNIISINSANTGVIENMDIGLLEPANANFLSVNIGPGDSTGELTVQGNATFDNIAVDQVNIVNGPTASNHATRKDYVDSRIAAFAIAFGA